MKGDDFMYDSLVIEAISEVRYFGTERNVWLTVPEQAYELVKNNIARLQSEIDVDKIMRMVSNGGGITLTGVTDMGVYVLYHIVNKAYL